MRRRNRGRWFRGIGRRRGQCVPPCRAEHPRALNDCHEGEYGIIVTNGDLKSMEMGLFLGARVEVLKNHSRDANIVVAVGPARYAISRATAEMIFIK